MTAAETALPCRHQFVDRVSGELRDEKLYHDALVRWLYSDVREKIPFVFNAVTARWMTRCLGLLNYDSRLSARISGNRSFLAELGVDLDECVAGADELRSARQVFERQIRYWECRPMEDDPHQVVSPCDARVLVGSFAENSQLVIKDKFFSFEELLGCHATSWLTTFSAGDFAVLRLTPEKYHYNHTPVAGEVQEVYEVGGAFHSCNPEAVVRLVTPYSKNSRVVTILDTDVEGGTGVGLVAMVEVVALMIGKVHPCYSEREYADPRALRPGDFVRKGQPKSLFRPGSSTVVLMFEPNRVQFCPDILHNLTRPAESRFSIGFEKPLLETEVTVRSALGQRLLHDSIGEMNGEVRQATDHTPRASMNGAAS